MEKVARRVRPRQMRKRKKAIVSKWKWPRLRSFGNSLKNFEKRGKVVILLDHHSKEDD